MPGADFPSYPDLLIESPIGSLDQAGGMRKAISGNWRYMRILGRYALVLLRDGSGVYEDVRAGRQRVQAGNVLVLFPDIAHRYGPEADDALWDEVWVIFSGPVFDLWRRSGLLSAERPVLAVSDIDDWVARLQSLLAAQDPGGPEHGVQALVAFQAYLADLLANSGVGASEPAPPWLHEACRLMAEAGTVQVDLQGVAGSLGMSYETFRKRFRAYMGKSPGQYVSQIVVNRACELLYQGDLSVKAIAAELGFCNAFHFSRRFKEVTGQAPSHFAGRVTSADAETARS